MKITLDWEHIFADYRQEGIVITVENPQLTTLDYDDEDEVEDMWKVTKIEYGNGELLELDDYEDVLESINDNVGLAGSWKEFLLEYAD